MKKNNLLTLVTFVAALIIASGCSGPAKKEEQKSAAPSVDVITLTSAKLSASSRIPGELVSFRDVDLYAKVNSFVKQILVDVGSEVKQGQLLASLEAPEIMSQVVAARARVESAEAQYRASKATYERLSLTSKTPGTVSQNDLDQAENKMKSDMAQWEATRAAQRELSAMESYLEIRAPFDGVISAKYISQGAYVGPSGKGSDLPMFTLNEQRRLRLVVYVPEGLTRYVKEGNEIQFTVKPFPQKVFTAVVKRAAGALDKRLHAQRVEMDVINDNRQLLPGMLAEVTFQLASDNGGFVVPVSSIVNSTERMFVVTIKDKKFAWVDVKRGLESKGQVEVFGELAEGDQVVVRGQEELRDGTDAPAPVAAKPK